MNIHFAMQSVTGLRTNNEDAMLAVDLGNHCHFFAVADGMGGCVAGEIASNLALKKIREYLQEVKKEEFRDSGLKELLRKSILIAQNSLSERTEEQPALKGMGTTLTALLICNNKYAWANIGDSRIYHINNDRASLLTSDHTFLNDYLKEKNKTDVISDTIFEQYGHLITRAINGSSDVADIFPEEQAYKTLRKGDIFLMCSDGLITKDIRNNHQIFNTLINNTETLELIISKLIKRAEENGSKDNITAIIIKTEKAGPQDDEKTMRIPAYTIKKRRYSSKMWIIILMVIIMTVIFYYSKFFR